MEQGKKYCIIEVGKEESLVFLLEYIFSQMLSIIKFPNVRSPARPSLVFQADPPAEAAPAIPLFPGSLLQNMEKYLTISSPYLHHPKNRTQQQIKLQSLPILHF